MPVFLTSKMFGVFSQKGDKIKTWRRAKDKSQEIRWRKSKKTKAISPKVAARLQRP